jgi:hypothetical protein
MPNADSTRNPRKVAHRGAVIWGISAGLLLFLVGIRPLFSVGVNDTWLGVTTLIGGFFTLLPLSVLGIFRPRAAAYGITVATILLAANVAEWFVEPTSDLIVSPVVLLLFGLCLLASPAGVASLLFYSSRTDPPAGPQR